jgi:aspartate/methionine/tyrosine aminotransferase
MKNLSKVTELFTESVIREMTRICDSMNGYNLSQGFPDFESPFEIKEAACEAIRMNLNQYPVTFGEPELRNAISKKALWYNKMNVDPEKEITVTCGATEAMIATLKAIINPGDEVIIFEPFYENYGADTILSGAVPRYVTLQPPHWNFDIELLKKVFNNKTKAIVINTPNNPTGKVFTRKELEMIIELCLKWDVIAVTDEIYEHIIYDSIEHISIASFPEMRNRSVTINSISKTYSVTGWRVGWAIAEENITARIRKVHDFLTVGAPTPFQHAAIKALSFHIDYYTLLSERYKLLRNQLYNILNKNGFRAFSPEGAYYILAEYSNLLKILPSESDIDFSVNLLKKTGVATVPGSSFFSSGSNTGLIRFAFCKRKETLDTVGALLETKL